MVGNLYAQSCRELFEENIKRAKQLYDHDGSMVQWLDLRDEMKKLKTNACEGEFTDQEDINILEYLKEICKRVSDFKQYFMALIGKLESCFFLENLSSCAAAIIFPSFKIQAALS